MCYIFRLTLSYAVLAISTAAPMPESCHAGGGRHCNEPPECNLPDKQSTERQILPPSKFDSSTLHQWHDGLKSMRSACQSAISYNSSIFDSVPELQWTQTAYVSPQMHPYDRYFFDPAVGNGTGGIGYKVEEWLDDLNKRYGGIDKALVWPTYTQIGIDDRNQWDMILTLPGGPEGVCAMAKRMQAAGVKVLWPYHPWDHSTQGQERNNETDPQSMAEMLKATCSDGFNGDTMGHIPREFYDAAVNLYKPIAMEPEGTPPAWDFNYATVGWAEGYANGANKKDDITDASGTAPEVDKPKWITNSRRQNNWCERWVFVKIPSLQVSWFNGLGYESWENVWGTWNQITERDGEAIRRFGAMIRFFGKKGHILSSEWVPHSEEVLQTSNGVFGSAWPLSATGETLWTLVNRNLTRAIGAQIRPKTTHYNNAALHYYDCYNGKELHLEQGVLSFEILATDFGCVIATPNSTSTAFFESSWEHKPPITDDLSVLLRYMGHITRKPLSSFSPKFSLLKQKMVPAPKIPVRPAGQAKDGEVYVPASRGLFHFKGAGVEIEGGGPMWPGSDKQASGVDVQFPWEDQPYRTHDKANMSIGAMYVDKHPVTNTKYAEYLKASGYKPPSDSARWLMHWEDGKPKPGWENMPVTYVSLNDARAYCKFHKKRLPHVYEWQYFAQGLDMRTYPWGNNYDSSREAQLVPAISNNFTNPGPEPVGKYPKGASPFGVEDLVGSVWQMTSEFQDDHNRVVILRGGSNYGPWREPECRDCGYGDNHCASIGVPGSYDLATGKNLSHPFCGSKWYFPPTFRNDQWNKYFLMSDSWERAGTLGFRCIADAQDTFTAEAAFIM